MKMTGEQAIVVPRPRAWTALNKQERIARASLAWFGMGPTPIKARRPMRR
ncbi:hypothetical protein LJR225_000597 [Phenylobacterium sp. LjRoot225]